MLAVRCDVLRFDDAERLAAGVAGEVLRLAEQAVAARGRFRLALAGGTTPRAAYAALARSGAARGTDWSRWDVWFGDERLVPPDHPDNNARMAAEVWHEPAGVPSACVHRVRTELGDPGVVAADYEAALRAGFALDALARPVFDLVLLGLGADGHSASWFPGSSALYEVGRLVAPVWVEKFAAYRVTLTEPVVNAARHVRFVVSGADKAAALRALLEEDGPASVVPARLVSPAHGDLAVFADAAAAAALSRRTP